MAQLFQYHQRMDLLWLVESEQGCTVGYNGWHEEFSDKNEALNCFTFGLSAMSIESLY